MSDFDIRTWNINGTAIKAPAGLLPDGILGDSERPEHKLQGARRYDRKRYGKQRDRERQELREF